MPDAAKRPCRKTGCRVLVLNGYCEAHKSNERQYDRWRGSSSERGYDNAWWWFRRDYLRRNPLCRDCQAAGIVKLAEEVHHTRKLSEHPESKFDGATLMGLCKAHHSARTARGE